MGEMRHRAWLSQVPCSRTEVAGRQETPATVGYESQRTDREEVPRIRIRGFYCVLSDAPAAQSRQQLAGPERIGLLLYRDDWRSRGGGNRNHGRGYICDRRTLWQTGAG